MQISNDGGFGDAEWEPYASHKAWTLTRYGDYVVPRIVYARFKDYRGVVSSEVIDDIILDVTPPRGAVSASTLSAGATAQSSRVATLNLSASDDSVALIRCA